MKIRGPLLVLVGYLFIVTPVFADDAAEAAHKDAKEAIAKGKEKPDEKKEELKDKVFVTTHSTKIHDKEIKYTATAGKLVMKDDEGKPKALVFFVAYTKNGVEKLSDRPVSFAFNGGRGLCTA